MYRMTPRLQRSHFLSYENASPVNVPTTSGAMYSAEPTGVRRTGVGVVVGVVAGVWTVDGVILAKSKSHMQRGVTFTSEREEGERWKERGEGGRGGREGGRMIGRERVGVGGREWQVF